MGKAAIFVMWPGPFEHAFVLPSHRGSIWNLASIGLVVIEEKKFKNIECEKFSTLTIGTHKASCTHLADCIYQPLYHRL